MEELKSIESGVSVSAHGHRQFAEANCFHPGLFCLKFGFGQEIWLLESICPALESKGAVLESISFETESI